MTDIRWQLKAGLMAAVAFAGIAHQDAWAQGERLWIHQSGQGAENWNAQVVSIGDFGSQVMTAFGPFTDYTRIFSEYDQANPTPIVESIATSETRRHRVASAKEANIHVTLHDVDSGSPFNTRNVIVKKFSSSSDVADWSYTFPEITNGHEGTNVHVSNDGQRIVALMHNIYQNATDIAVFSPDSNVPTAFYSVSLSTPLTVSLLSDDASTLYMRSNSRIVLYDLNGGDVRHSTILFGGIPYSDAIAGDGSIFAYSTYNDVKVYTDDQGYWGDPQIITLPGDNYCGKLAISANNKVIAMGFNYYDAWLRTRLQVREIASNEVILDRDLIGGGTYQNLVSDLCLSADGSRVAIGLWGDEDGLIPEVSVFNTNSGIEIARFDTDGSVNDMDFSRDGRRLAVASKKTHANVVAGGGQVELFSVGARDFTMSGVPTLGSTVQFSFKARAGKLASLLMATTLEAAPEEVEDLGILRLPEDLMTSTQMGIVPDGDWITVDYTIPNDPALVGTTLHFQGFATSPRTLSRSWVSMTILP